MAESKSSPIEPTVTEDRHAGFGPERLDRAHTASAGTPHANFASRADRSTSKMPIKLQERMDRLMADLAALDEPQIYTPAPGEFTEIPPHKSALQQANPHEATANLPEATGPTPAPSPDEILADPVASDSTVLGQNEANMDEDAATDLSLKLIRNEKPETSEPATHEYNFVSGIEGVSLTAISGSFSQQAREILEILRRRQEQLSYQKNELELREASLEKQMRQERLALVEKQRQLLAQVSIHHADGGAEEQDATASRRITPDLIAHHERGVPVSDSATEVEAAEVEAAGSVGEEPPQEKARAKDSLKPSTTSSVPYQAVIEEYVRRQAVSHNETQHHYSEETPTLRQQADQLRQQHESAIHAMRQTRRQLELLKDIIIQQQEQWVERSNDLDAEQVSWSNIRRELYEAGKQRQEELEQLQIIEQNEQAKRLVSLDHREAAIRNLEERLQQAQVEILRDRVIIKQLERTARQSLSNADWNQRWQVISEETQSYLKKVNDEAQSIYSETARQMERLASRKTEMLLYRESLRNWIERQMKLISRRSAHVEDREQQLQERWESLQEGRHSLHEQQMALNQLIADGLDSIDQRLDQIPTPSRHQEAA